MQIVQENAPTTPAFGVALGEGSAVGRSSFADYKVIRRNGAVVGFEPAKISVAMTKAFLAVNGAHGAASARIRELVVALTDTVVAALLRRHPQGGTFHIEDIQDQVELALMRSGEHDVARGIEAELLDPELGRFDLARLGRALKAERDLKFGYLGLQTLYDRYFLHVQGRRIELPQAFFMRVAMGLALKEKEREARAIEFYEALSSFDFMSSTPTLFNSGTLRSQLSSCHLTTVSDDLEGIYEAIKENALLAKYAGGLGNDWTPVRALGSHIKGTNGKSQGVVPFLKVVSDTAVAVNQCFAPSTGVFTANGVKAIKDVDRGDLVLGRSGTYREVTQRYAYNQTAAMVSIKVKHSIEPLMVTAGHPFYAVQGVPLEQSNERTFEWLQKGKVKPQWVDAVRLCVGDYVAQVIPTEVVAVTGLTDEDARMYGILLGDGHLSKDAMQWGVSGNPSKDQHLAFVR